MEYLVLVSLEHYPDVYLRTAGMLISLTGVGSLCNLFFAVTEEEKLKSRLNIIFCCWLRHVEAMCWQ